MRYPAYHSFSIYVSYVVLFYSFAATVILERVAVERHHLPALPRGGLAEIGCGIAHAVVHTIKFYLINVTVIKKSPQALERLLGEIFLAYLISRV